MRRALTTLLLTVAYLAVLAQVALAEKDPGHDGGEGWWGETNDKVITNAGFLIIAAIPLFVLTMSLLQHTLDKRKERRKKAAKARAGAPEWSGGW